MPHARRPTLLRLDYVDDTGFTADGDFRDGVLYHAGMVLHRESPSAPGS